MDTMYLHNTYLHIYLIGWFTETHFAEFPCYPSLNYFSPIQITTVKSFGPIRYDLDRLILYSPTKCIFVRYFAYLVRKKGNLVRQNDIFSFKK
jgi:hypothetical protein